MHTTGLVKNVTVSTVASGSVYHWAYEGHFLLRSQFYRERPGVYTWALLVPCTSHAYSFNFSLGMRRGNAIQLQKGVTER